MFDEQVIYGLTGMLLFVVGLRGALLHPLLLGQIIAFNISGAGLFLTLVAVAYDGGASPADPVIHALVLTGIVVAISATAFALAIARRIRGNIND